MTTRPHHYRRILAALLAAAIATLAFAAIATAAHGTQVRLSELDGELRRGQLRLEYTIAKRSWREIDARGVEPTLVLERLSKRRDRSHGTPRFYFLYSQTLHARKGTFTFPRSLDLDPGDELRMKLVGYDKDWRITGLRHGTHRGPSLALHLHGRKLAVGTPHHQQPPPTSPPPPPAEQDEDPKWRVKVIAACKETVQYDSQVDDCTKLAFGKLDKRWAASAVAACKEGVQYKSQWDDCIKLAATFTRDPSQTIRACKASVQYASQWGDCLKASAKHRAEVDSPALLDACKDSVKYASQRLGCFKLGDELGADGADLVRACKGSRDLEKCVRSANGAGR